MQNGAIDLSKTKLRFGSLGRTARSSTNELPGWVTWSPTRQELEAARNAVQRAHKQYDAADPEHRLVADELERRWNQALQRVREIEGRIDQHVQGHRPIPAPPREAFESLAAGMEAVWNGPHADGRLKKTPGPYIDP